MSRFSVILDDSQTYRQFVRPEGHHRERGVRRETRKQDHGLNQLKWGTEKGLRGDLRSIQGGCTFDDIFFFRMLPMFIPIPGSLPLIRGQGGVEVKVSDFLGLDICCSPTYLVFKMGLLSPQLARVAEI